MDNDIKKRFPADTTLDKITFLNNKHINGELYAYLQSISTARPTFKNEDEFETIVEYHNLPSQAEICRALGIKSPKTYKTHLQYLIDEGFVIEGDDGYRLPNVEDKFFYIPLETLRYLRDNCKDHVIKIYIYLGQKYKYAERELGRKYEFSIDELAQHIGLKTNNNSRVYEVINHALELLYNSGLIDYCQFYDGQVRKKKLLAFRYEYNKKDGR